jgi:membrane protease YdiL (CAAX protease family)
VYLVGGPIQEEPGWRGFAIPHFLQRFSPMMAALIVGFFHTIWHVPLFLTAEWDTARGEPTQFLAYFLLVISLSILLSWLYNRGDSVGIWLSIIGHNSLNWGLMIVATLSGAEIVNNWPAAIGLAVLAGVITILTRGKLGFEPHTCENILINVQKEPTI